MVAMSTDCIVLSSDEDEESPPCKKSKPTELPKKSRASIIDLKETQVQNHTTIIENKPEGKNCADKPGTSKFDQGLSSELPEHLTLFLEVCSESVQDSKNDGLRNKFSIIKKFYKKCSPEIQNSNELRTTVESNIEVAKKSPACAVIAFYHVCQYLKQVSHDDDSIVLEDEEDYLALEKLWKKMKALKKIIKKLEEKEVDFDDEEDSTYIKLDKYKLRLKQIYKLYCKLSDINPHSGSITHQKIVFVDSQHEEINQAISKNYKNNKVFPDYGEIEELVRKTVKDYKLPLSEQQIILESRKCFKKLGDLLQARRKKELYVSHISIISEQDDPASKDAELNSRLKANYIEAKKKINEIYQQFEEKEENLDGEGSTSEGSESENSNSEEESNDSDDF